MSRILMLYASNTGNTEQVMEIIKDFLQSKQYDIVVKSFEFDPIDEKEVLAYDAVLIGTYTWDDGELPYEVEDFYEDIEEVDINGVVMGVFGSADSFYDTYGGAVDLMADRLEALGAEVLSQRLKVDLEPDKEDEKSCRMFAEAMMEKILQKSHPI
ncbi:flavodoxin [Virgibacillus xinjiangensis]|uniref:Flavodoxin n=1 Tax=Virgibacillus xinjiangensis TaxID=393090 RepID=A0ABV7CYF3_9BACI